jgi:3-deoxy-D-manno-octulosonic-acid transferase
MYFLYSTALSLVFLVMLPYFIYQAMRHGKYASSFKERMGWLPESLANDNRQVIWIHAVSVGEFLAAKPLLERIRREMPGSRIVVSTTTLTGQRLAREHANAPYDATFYFPFDWRFTVRRALARVNPSMVIILETELWPNFLRECQRLGIITIIANGRISPRSFARYKRIRKFLASVLENLTLMLMQSDADAERALALGARAGIVSVCGNLKYDIEDGAGLSPANWPGSGKLAERVNPATAGDMSAHISLDQEIDNQFGLSSSPHLIVAGSTAPGEEKILLTALREARRERGLEDTRLILAPRHPERFNEVASLISQSEFKLARRAEAKTLTAKALATAQDANAASSDSKIRSRPRAIRDELAAMRAADVILLDTIGELASLYRFAAVVFVGGSLVPRGGHNIIEPAIYSKPIIVGPHMENFHNIISDFARADALVQVSATGEGASISFTREIIRLLTDHEFAVAMGVRARDILLKSRGATDCTIEAIKAALSAED